MPTWPPITEPELLDRLALDDTQFADFVARLVSAVGRRPYSAQVLAHALAYPWERPERSYVFSDGRVELLHELATDRRERVLAAFVGGDAARTPLLAFGSNGAPATLERKFAHFEAPTDRAVLVLAGHLCDFDVGASAHPALYGAMPATIFPSPGTRVRAALLWLTAPQFVQLVWSEISYRLGHLDTRFESDEPELSVTGVTAFVSRFGAFAPDGPPVAMAAVPATGRTARALTQEQLLDAAAALAIGRGATAADLVRGVFEHFEALVPRLATTVRRTAVPFASERWTPFEPAGNQ